MHKQALNGAHLLTGSRAFRSFTAMTKRKRQEEVQSHAPAKWHVTRLRRTPARRKRADVPRRPNAVFEHLNKDIRILVYDYLALPPVVYACETADRSGFPAVCRQAHREAQEQRFRQLWMRLEDLRKAHISDTRYSFSIPSCLTSADDLAGLRHLMISVQGPLPKALPQSLHFLKKLHIDALTIHYSGTPPCQKDLVSKARTVFCDAFDGYDDWHSEFSLKQFTLSWDYRRGKEADELSGNIFELTPEVKTWARNQVPATAHKISKWPIVVLATQGERCKRVGIWRLNVGTRSAKTTVGLHQLLVTVGEGRVADIGTQTVASEVMVQYEPIEEDFV